MSGSDHRIQAVATKLARHATERAVDVSLRTWWEKSGSLTEFLRSHELMGLPAAVVDGESLNLSELVDLIRKTVVNELTARATEDIVEEFSRTYIREAKPDLS